MKRAVIDIGSNTINLLIGTVSENGNLSIVHDEKIHAKLAKGGLVNGKMTDEALERGYKAIEHYASVCAKNEVSPEQTKVYATATIRNTSNGDEFTNQLKSLFNLDTNIISGEEEALFIFKGVLGGFPIADENVMVMDIGGGSVEFIIGNKNNVLFAMSFPIGVSKMLDKFKPSDPVTLADIGKMKSYFTDTLAELFNAISEHKPQHLIGSSGSFDTLRSILEENYGLKADGETWTSLPGYNLDKLFNLIIESSSKDRAKIPGMDPMRIDYMPVAAILIATVLNESQITSVNQCAYALKEGALLA